MRYIFGGKNYYIAIFPSICQGEKNDFFPGGNLLYSHFSGGDGYGGKMAL